MPVRDGEYIIRSTDDEYEVVAEQLLKQQPNANPRAPSTFTYGLLRAVTATIIQEQEQSLQSV